MAGCGAWAGLGLIGPVERSTIVGLAAIATLLAVPYVIAGEVGILGVGINFDLSVHVAWAETLRAEDRRSVTPRSRPEAEMRDQENAPLVSSNAARGSPWHTAAGLLLF